MEGKSVALKTGGTLTAYALPLTSKVNRAVIVCPGGGYDSINKREGEPVAEELNKKGYVSFVLDYSISPNRYPKQVIELAHAVKHVRDNAIMYNIDPKKITIMGFSAGGHLAASLATQWQYDYLQDAMGCSAADYIPNSCVLCYPLITGGAYAHRASLDNLLGGDLSKLELVSLERCVTYDCPPIFIWHTVDDKVVPVENTLLFISALRQKNVPFEAHLFPKGEHGLSLATSASTDSDDASLKNAHVSQWFNLATKWIKTV